jgi:myo-inositol-1(or 4)-monophosphatase
LDIVVECSLKVWDWAALMPVIEGAGGAMTDWQGQRLRRGGDGHVIAVGDRRLLPGVVAGLQP